MSRALSNQSWGPSHQDMEPPFRGRSSILSSVVGVVGVLILLSITRIAFDPGGGSVIGWAIKAVIALAILRAVLMLVMGVLTRTPQTSIRPAPPARVIDRPRSPDAAVRQRILRAGGGAYLGVSQDGEWAAADPESAVMVLGPPRSGKTTAVMIPALMAASGPAVSTSTKPDVMAATMRARSEIGEVWLFDPAATEPLLDGVRRLSWSPVAAAASWDDALVMARAMTAATRAGSGTTNENHWTERAAALLAPLLYAAHQSERPIGDVLKWILRKDLAPALQVLEDCDGDFAAAVLIGIHDTDDRERSSIFSATAGVLAAYNSDAVRASAACPNFDPKRFTDSRDTIYITAPEHKQALCAPLIVGMLEQIRHCVYDRARTSEGREGNMLWLLDEVANTAPIHDLPALISQAGGQNLQVMVGLQDLSQARTRWGSDAADGFMSLFQTKTVLSGIADSKTLESISLALGEYDRDMVSQALGQSDPQEWLSAPTQSDTVSYQTQRQRVLTPGEIARLPDGQGLLLRGTDWELIKLTKWHETEPWKTIAGPGAR
ncbi:MAG TPA: type IV secretory system conjugative DNA transfer family protein [Solirubrobacteraceae bacterium]